MTATFVVFGMKVYSEMYQKIVITKVGWLRFRLNRFWRWLLEITPSQQNGSREDYRGQGIQTIELDGNRLEVKGFYNGTSPWAAAVNLTAAQLAVLRGAA